jgi:hypothetical protein
VAYTQLEFFMMSQPPIRILKQRWPVDLARNFIVQCALDCDKEPTHIFWLDDDVLPHPAVIKQLFHADKDIVTGVYFGKTSLAEPIIFGKPGEGVIPYVPGSGLHRCYGHGMGLTLIRTEVFRRMRDEMDLGVDTKGNPRWFYVSGDRPGEKRKLTEDLWFLSKAYELGYESWFDSHPNAFGFHMDPHEDTAYPEPQWKQWIEEGSFHFPVPEHLRSTIQPDLIVDGPPNQSLAPSS